MIFSHHLGNWINMKSTVVAVAALVASAQYAAAAPSSTSTSPDEEYRPLLNPGSGECITLSEYNAYSGQNRAGADTYLARSGPCSAAVKFRYNQADRTLQTPDNYCLSALDDISSKEKGMWVGVGLEKCSTPAKSRMQWDLVPQYTNQWRNVENGLCLDSQGVPIYAVLTDTCDSPLAPSGRQQFIFQGETPNPAPLKAPVEMTCREFAKKVGGDKKVW